MWNKLSFRLKITVIFSLSLMVLTASLTIISMMNVQQTITNPMQTSLDVTFINNPLNIDDILLIDTTTDNENMSDFILSDEDLERLMEEFGDTVNFIDHTQLQEQLTTTQHDFRLYSIWVAVAVIILGTFGAYLIAGIIVQPLKKLSTSMKEMEADKLRNNLPIPKSQDEISQLTESFNTMLYKLHRTFESKQLFAQNVAHELKTPLAITRMDMEVLEMNQQPTVADYAETFVEIKKNTERMIGLVEGLLAMGKTVGLDDIATFSGRDLFEGIFEDLTEQIHAKKLDIQINGNATLKGEKNLLPQAFFNIISNAVRYNTDDGCIVVTLSETQITIDDTGIGIPPESIEQLFDPFYCVDKSRSKKLGGNGLGLAITKNILEAHKMDIDINSEVGFGTTITVHF